MKEFLYLATIYKANKYLQNGTIKPKVNVTFKKLMAGFVRTLSTFLDIKCFTKSYAIYTRQVFFLHGWEVFPEGQQYHKRTVRENTDHSTFHGTDVYNLWF